MVEGQVTYKARVESGSKPGFFLVTAPDINGYVMNQRMGSDIPRESQTLAAHFLSANYLARGIPFPEPNYAGDEESGTVKHITITVDLDDIV